jgi:acyl dehydratase
VNEPRIIEGPEGLKALVGETIGTTGWMAVTQDQVDRFADATGDHQWIHVDEERAADGPFGGTIAHGFLTLSLLPHFVKQTYRIEGTKMGVNYGLNRVRFTSPVPVGSKVRGNVELVDVADIEGGVQMTTKVTVEIEGSERPALVAEWLTRQFV